MANLDMVTILTTATGVLAALVVAIRTVMGSELKLLREKLKREQVERARLQKNLDETTAQVEALLAKLREVQDKMLLQASHALEESEKRIQHSQDLLTTMNHARGETHQRLCQVEGELTEMRKANRRLEQTLHVIASESRLLALELQASNFKGDNKLSLEELHQILARKNEEENYGNPRFTGQGRDRHGAGRHPTSASHSVSGADDQAFLAAS